MAPQDLARLDGDLTPMGAVRAGNADGLIPPWTGAVRGVPPGVKWDGPGTPYPDPWPDEQPLFTITVYNFQQYRDRLAPGAVALFETYPATFRMPVYPSHREFGYRQAYYDKARYNAEHAELTGNDESLTGYVGGPAFLVPANGAEGVWRTRTTGGSSETMAGEMHDFFVFGNGTRSDRRINIFQQMPYASTKIKPERANEYPNLGMISAYVMNIQTAPARDKGTITLVLEPVDFASLDREAWRYLPGSRRVRRAPTVGFDTPEGPGGIKTVDEVKGFNGPLERYRWQLLGLQEMFIPYHNYRFDDPGVTYDTLLTHFHANPDYMRYELKRVWVVEGTLREGMRHVYAKRRLYVDEDTGLTALTESYDGHGELWKVSLFNNIYEYGTQSYQRRAEMYHDLRGKSYAAERLINDIRPFLFDVEPPKPVSYFTSTNVRKLGRR